MFMDIKIRVSKDDVDPCPAAIPLFWTLVRDSLSCTRCAASCCARFFKDSARFSMRKLALTFKLALAVQKPVFTWSEEMQGSFLKVSGRNHGHGGSWCWGKQCLTR
jgi:hypothetical protein